MVRADYVQFPDGDRVCRCGECGERYVITPKGSWQNHFLCSEQCCAVRRARYAPEREDEEDW